MAEDITYFSKDEIHCPVCGADFRREDLLTGRGRLSAGELTNELRRTYQPTQKYGSVNPLIYPITVCPSCLYATDDFDFLSVPQKTVPNIQKYRTVRADYLLKVFGKIPDFKNRRDLISGVASYILAMSCYSFFDKRKFSSTIKTAIYSLRSAWLFSDLFNETRDARYQELSGLFYRKASQGYDQAIENQTKAVESLDGVKNLGPDTDKNFGYDGVLYVSAILKYKTAYAVDDPYEKLKIYEQVKRTLSKVFGIGKKAKDRPEVLLNFSKDIYEKMAEETAGLQSSLGQIEQSVTTIPALEGDGSSADAETV